MMPTASPLRNLKQALGTYRRALEEFERALLELEESPVCEVCGEALRDTRRDAKTCSAACRQKAYRRRAQHLSPRGRGKHSRAILDAPVPALPERERVRGHPAK
jgi:RNA polymerase-binding transcription factor DksA